MKNSLIFQIPGSFETRALQTYAYQRDIETFRVSLENLSLYTEHLCAGHLPVGSVEFVREAMRLAGIAEPETMSYPDALLTNWAHRAISLIDKRSLPGSGAWFIKPAGGVKLFDGFIRGIPLDNEEENRHRQEQEALLAALPDSAPLWISEPVKFVSECRYYVLENNILGWARYDPDGADDAPMPDTTQVQQMIRDHHKGEALQERPHLCAYSLDVGVLDNGQTALVEVNDAWALGLYRGMTDIAGYLQMLSSRWQQLKT